MIPAFRHTTAEMLNYWPELNLKRQQTPLHQYSAGRTRDCLPERCCKQGWQWDLSDVCSPTVPRQDKLETLESTLSMKPRTQWPNRDHPQAPRTSWVQKPPGPRAEIIPRNLERWKDAHMPVDCTCRITLKPLFAPGSPSADARCLDHRRRR